jgi:hypothetical protein
MRIEFFIANETGTRSTDYIEKTIKAKLVHSEASE